LFLSFHGFYGVFFTHTPIFGVFGAFYTLKKQNGKIIPESEKISETAQETGTMNCCRK